MATFPSSLPSPSHSAYVLEPVDPVVRTDMEQGSTRSRKRFRQAPTKVSVSWTFSVLQMAIFEAWHRYEVNDGTDWFDIDLINGQSWQTYQAKFKGMWKATAAGKLFWTVTASLEIEDRALMSEQTLQGYL